MSLRQSSEIKSLSGELLTEPERERVRGDASARRPIMKASRETWYTVIASMVLKSIH